MNEQTYDLTVVFIVRNCNSTDFLNSCLGGDFEISKKQDSTTYILKQKYVKCDNVGSAVESFCYKNHITPLSVKKLQSAGVCALRLFLQSDFAQIGFGFSPSTMAWMATLNVPIEVSILSWGGA